MLTETKKRPKIPAGIETVDYPPEVIEHLRKNFEITKLQIATGEIPYITVEELASTLGISLDD